MKLNYQYVAWTLAGLSSGLSVSLAAAQTATAPAPSAAAVAPAPAASAPAPMPSAAPATPAPATTAAVAPAPVTAEASAEVAVPAPMPEPAPVAEPEPPMAPEPPMMDAPEAPAAEEAPESTGTPGLMVFADAWAGIQTAKSGTADGGGGVYANNGPSGTAESGFGINWLGADLSYDGGEWGATGSLRFGDAVAIYGTGTLGPITNAYATWRPTEGLAIDVGAFGTIYGAEVAESWNNLNYTRGELYFNMQPFWHTGIRAEYAAGELVFRGLLVNDANNSNLGGGAVNGGAQVGYDNGSFALLGGVLQSFAPETTINNGGFIGTFVDVVMTVSAGDFSLVGNFDLNAGSEAPGYWGASLAAGYQFTPQFGAAVRGEYLASKDGFLFGSDDDKLMTGTLTLDLKPVAGVDNFVVRWDNRIEKASEDVYANSKADDVKDTWFASTVGVVAYADLL